MNPHWYRYDPAAPRWKYIVTRPVHFYLPGLDGDYGIFDAKGETQLSIVHRHFLSILPGYAFDGATYAPDVKKLMKAVALHDFLCQAALQHPENWPISRAQADREFLLEGLITAPILARIYYAGIRVGGLLHRTLFPPGPEDSLTIIPAAA
jgi:hypothetical protein